MVRLELKKSEEARYELQQTIRETTAELKDENYKIHQDYGKIIKQKAEYIENLKDSNVDSLKELKLLKQKTIISSCKSKYTCIHQLNLIQNILYIFSFHNIS